MLEADPIFLQSRMKLTITDDTRIQLLENSLAEKSAIGEWDYPHWFPITLKDLQGNSIRVIPKTAFNKFLILPRNLNPNRLFYIKSSSISLQRVKKVTFSTE
jgi:hypothetical protein